MPKIEIYTTATCPFCDAAKNLLTTKNLAFTEIDASDTTIRAAMVERAGANNTTVPQIFINDAHIGGCDNLYALEHAKELDALLQKN